PGGQAANEFISYSYIETLARPALSGRLGIQSGDWTIYGKAGLGIAYNRYTQVSDGRGTINCSAITQETRHQGVSGGESTQEYWQTECLNPQRGQLTSKSQETWTPVAVYGLGAEYDFGQYFARG